MNKNVINFFKRNATATAAHLVLDTVFADLKRAEAYRKQVNAKKVSSFLRSEYEAAVGSQESGVSKDGSASSPSGDNAGQ